MATITTTVTADDVTNKGKRAKQVTVGAGSAADTIAFAPLGLNEVTEVWLRVDPSVFTISNTAKTLTAAGTVTAGTYRIVGS